MDIQGKTIVLTGATGGIGRAIAARLDAANARLILVARDRGRLDALTGQLESRWHAAIAADLATDAGRSNVVAACRTTDGGIDLLLNAAGINDFDWFDRQSADAIRRLVEVNLLSPMLLCRELLPLLQQREEARIINIGSTFGSIGYPGFSGYCATKFGLRGFTEALRRELDGTKTSATYVAPRATRTALNSDAVVAMNDALGTAMDDPALVADEVLRVIGRPARQDTYIGWPEKLFVRINALFPKLVDSSMRRQLPIIRRFAARQP
jgi:short-subunit dehydrogenase